MEPLIENVKESKVFTRKEIAKILNEIINDKYPGSIPFEFEDDKLI